MYIKIWYILQQLVQSQKFKMGIRITTEVQSVEQFTVMEGTDFGLLWATTVNLGIMWQVVG